MAAYVIPVSLKDLAQGLRLQLSLPSREPYPSVVWMDGDSEIVVHLSELEVSLQPGLVLIRLSTETDQTGASTIVIPFSIGSSRRDAYLVGVTETIPRGDPLLASRWGRPVQDLLWRALLSVGQSEFERRHDGASETVVGLYVSDSLELDYIVA